MKKIFTIIALGLTVTAFGQTPSNVSNIKTIDEPKTQGRVEKTFDISQFEAYRPETDILPIKFLQVNDLTINLGGELIYQPESDVTKNLPFTDSRVLIVEIPKDSKISEADLKKLNELVKKLVK